MADTFSSTAQYDSCPVILFAANSDSSSSKITLAQQLLQKEDNTACSDNTVHATSTSFATTAQRGKYCSLSTHAHFDHHDISNRTDQLSKKPRKVKVENNAAYFIQAVGDTANSASPDISETASVETSYSGLVCE